ncbi:MAG TPA: SAM-dependent methyltransferase [Magnetospirillaceae bacterium]|nr:SAM-dependent methyltransferase [Magnetospirillaceae bacterium]
MIEDFLRRQIQATGAMPVGEFMRHCVTSYYAGRDPFGREGDFITAPEISQMFGEMIGLWSAITWQMMGTPQEVMLVELGPGRGTLMSDLLRAAGAMPDFRAAVRIHLVETSPVLREFQREALAGTEVVWHEDIAELPDGPAIFIANEFFDALPIEQYVYRAEGWHERMVTCRDAFAFTDGPAVSERRMAELGAPEAKSGEVFEVNPDARRLVQTLAQRFARQPGVLLAIDYGYDQSAVGDTLQAVRGHQPAPVLQTPGEADLTAHVDFDALARAADGAKVSPIVGQGSFLRRLGIELRAERLAAAHPEKAEDLLTGCHRLINPGGMGTLFKVLALSSPTLPDLPGFAP